MTYEYAKVRFKENGSQLLDNTRINFEENNVYRLKKQSARKQVNRFKNAEYVDQSIESDKQLPAPQKLDNGGDTGEDNDNNAVIDPREMTVSEIKNTDFESLPSSQVKEIYSVEENNADRKTAKQHISKYL